MEGLIKTIIAVMVLVGTGCNSSPSNGQYSVEVAFPGLSFTRPVDLQNAGDTTNRLFVVEQAGVIRVFPNEPSVNDSKIFLDIRGRVEDSGNEEGLLGLAFHPDFRTNGFFYVNYTASDPDRTSISRFTVSATDADQADPNSEVVLLTIPQPFGNHNGGQISFGPDGMLYIAVGDGGSGGDPRGNGQNLATLLGTILRIDVDTTTDDLPYGIPLDNPFVSAGQAARGEIYAYGLRNPWRFSFDSQTGALWAGDVGQNRFEEIDTVEAGKNYGWNITEGFECYDRNTCNTDGLEIPVHAYPHESGNSSVTGGFVYRGSRDSDLHGTYVYADFSSGRVWGLRPEGQGFRNDLLVDTPTNISSFGVDEADELYLCAFDGRIYGLVAPGATSNEDPTGSAGFSPLDAFPNPFFEFVTLTFAVRQPGPVIVDVYDILGRKVAGLLNGYLERGTHTLTWNGKDSTAPLAAGAYFVVVRQGTSMETTWLHYDPAA